MQHKLALAPLVFLTAAAVAPAQQPAPETVERHLAAMGTHLTLEVTAPTRAAALTASEAAVRAIEATEVRLSTWRSDSELARLNAAPAGEPFALSPELAGDLALARDVWRETDGAFDPGIGALTNAWGLRTGGRAPSPDELEQALAGGGLGGLALDGATATRLRGGLVIDEGGFGKGVGLAAALDALRGTEAIAATLDLGGQIAIYGASDGGAARGGDGPLRFAVADPRDRAATVLEISVEHGSLATSGNSERGIVVDGERRSHILDPRTGAPARDFGSVTVWTEDPVRADALSTALFAMGPDAGLAWAAERPDVEVLYLLVVDGGLRARATAPWARRLAPTLPGLVVETADDPLSAWAVTLGSQPEPSPRQDVVDDTEQRLRDLEAQVEAFSFELERNVLGDLVPPIGESRSGMGPAASKVYAKSQGLSIGGYGEWLYQGFSGSTPAELDNLRAVFYFGYKFDENWVLNTEIEYEHGGEEVGVEFAYLDYLGFDALNVRAGHVLLPMGFVNELHEPTTFLTATRPDTERKILPTTWHENGVGIYGDLGPCEYRLYLVNGMDASGYSAEGLRGGRQGGSEALAEDLALVGRVDYVDVPGLLVGASAYRGDAGQGQAGLGDAGTTIYEAHAEWKDGGLWVRGLAAFATLDDVDTLNAGLGLAGADSVGEELRGFYGEVGYDVMQMVDPAAGIEVSPYVRWESIDTQAEVPSGFAADPANDERITTLGVRVSPIPQLVFKVEVMDRDRGDDSLNIGMGYVF